MNFAKLVDNQLSTLKVSHKEPLATWEESLVAISDAADACDHFASVGRHDEFLHSLTILAATAERAYSDHNLYANRTYREQAADGVATRRAARSVPVKTVDEGRGLLKVAVARLVAHFASSARSGDLRAILSDIYGHAETIAVELKLDELAVAQAEEKSDRPERPRKRPA